MTDDRRAKVRELVDGFLDTYEPCFPGCPQSDDPPSGPCECDSKRLTDLIILRLLVERDAEVKRVVEEVRLCPPTIARNPIGGLTPPAYIATVNAVCDEILRRLGLEE